VKQNRETVKLTMKIPLTDMFFFAEAGMVQPGNISHSLYFICSLVGSARTGESIN
jgi:hypothetical protein